MREVVVVVASSRTPLAIVPEGLVEIMLTAVK